MNMLGLSLVLRAKSTKINHSVKYTPVSQPYVCAPQWHGGFRVVLSLILCVVLLATGHPAYAQQRAMGADISYWNCGTGSGISQANWNSAFSAGRVFVFLRASRGGTTGLDQPAGTPGGGSVTNLSRRYDDSRFLQNLIRSTAAGMYVGSYHFARPEIGIGSPNSDGSTVTVDNTGTDEADHFVQMAGAWMRPGYMLPVLDLEAGANRTTAQLSTFSVAFSDRIYQLTGIRPMIYANSSYVNSEVNSTVAASMTNLWIARPSGDDPLTTEPPAALPTYPNIYGVWNPNYPNTPTPAPWKFWQHATDVSIPGINQVDPNVDSDAAHGDLEYVRDYLIPAIWWNDSSGDWSTLANWNSGQTPIAPVTGAGQASPAASTNGAMPTPRLPGAAGSGPTSGQYDTVILERPSASITVTLSGGTHNIRKLYVREALNITGGSLTINYDPAYRADDSTLVVHSGPISAQFSSPVSLNSSGALSVNTLQVDAQQIFTLGGGTLTFNKINLMPHSSSPARMSVTNGVTINSLLSTGATIAKGSGTGTSGYIDMIGQARTFTIGNGPADIDLSVDVPMNNGGLTKDGAGTMRLTAANTYGIGTILTLGRLEVDNTTGSGTGSGAVTVNGGFLCGTGSVTGPITLNVGGTIAPGTIATIGKLTLGNAPTFAGTNFMRINRNGGSPLADKIQLNSGTLNYGGTLVISNVGVGVQGGDVFTLYSAPAYAGSFANFNLPTLPPLWNWFTGALVTNGTIKVNRRPTTTPMTFSNVAPAGLAIPIATLVSNAVDADGDLLSLAGVNLVTTNGMTLATNATSIAYSNAVNMVDQFSYVLNDAHGGSVTGLVNVVYTAPPATPPSAQFTGTPTVNGTSVSLHFDAVAGGTYYVERSTNLLDWTTISTNVAPPSGEVDCSDDFSDVGGMTPAGFYRLRWWSP